MILKEILYQISKRLNSYHPVKKKIMFMSFPLLPSTFALFTKVCSPFCRHVE